jgi:hypothetical protein
MFKSLSYGIVRFQVFTAASMKMAAFWDVAPCSLVEVYRRFRRACYPIIALLEAASTSETSLNFYQTKWRYIPKDSQVQFEVFVVK